MDAGLWQGVVVGIAVAAAAAYLAMQWMPARWRRGVAQRLAAGARRLGLRDEAQAAQLAQELARKGGCGSCDSCGACGTPAATGPGADAGATGGTGAGPSATPSAVRPGTAVPLVRHPRRG